EERLLEARAEPRTGVPAFLGYTGRVPGDELGRKTLYTPQRVTLWPQFEEAFGPPPPGGHLADAVRGFFENRGTLCYVVPLDRADPPRDALKMGLDALASWETGDLVCTPDLIRMYPQEALPPPDSLGPVWSAYVGQLLRRWGRSPNPEEVTAMQNDVLGLCDSLEGPFAILDSLPGADPSQVLVQRQKLKGTRGALYYPWIKLEETTCVPPCGHVAGVYARSDRQVGVHKAPANEVLEGALDLEVSLTNGEQGLLNPAGVNCLRAFPGRGIRVWGARTLSRDENLAYVSVCRLLLTVARWVGQTLSEAVFEPHDPSLWAGIRRELTVYFTDLFQRGALKGTSPEEAFSVKCDEETSPPEVRRAGRLVAEVRLAPTEPNEFVILRIIQEAGGATVAFKPTRPRGSPGTPNPTGGGPPPELAITRIEYDPPGHDWAGEHVVIENKGKRPADLTGWTISDLAGHTFVFPQFTLHPGLSVRVWTKAGADTTKDLYWGRRGAAIWNNVGDRAFLRDQEGNLVHVYTCSALNRYPDTGARPAGSAGPG
ncbi:MAG: phage tail sheath subtilisin-like domain-containing protein, partial [Deltaproteobacteria bacterium]|nr:phage tail sheath subtilisin-like domain-containing protein [Deltaproteobacteria bacterium]